jgi:hypothetical protein
MRFLEKSVYNVGIIDRLYLTAIVKLKVGFVAAILTKRRGNSGFFEFEC